jgi:hypothetical protein
LSGAILCIKSLSNRKELDITGRVLSIITIVMCNPLFFLLYLLFCYVGGKGYIEMATMSFM